MQKERVLLPGSGAHAWRTCASVCGFSSKQFLWDTWLSPAPGVCTAASSTQWPAAASPQLRVQCLHKHFHKQLSLGLGGTFPASSRRQTSSKFQWHPGKFFAFNNLWLLSPIMSVSQPWVVYLRHKGSGCFRSLLFLYSWCF